MTRLLGITAAALCLLAPAARAATFTVDSNSGAASVAGHTTLTAAITAANSSAGTDTIKFTTGLGTIALSDTDVLPDLTDTVIIDACGATVPPATGCQRITQSGAGTPLIRVRAPDVQLIGLDLLTDDIAVDADVTQAHDLIIHDGRIEGGTAIETRADNITVGGLTNTTQPAHSVTIIGDSYGVYADDGDNLKILGSSITSPSAVTVNAGSHDRIVADTLTSPGLGGGQGVYVSGGTDLQVGEPSGVAPLNHFIGWDQAVDVGSGVTSVRWYGNNGHVPTGNAFYDLGDDGPGNDAGGGPNSGIQAPVVQTATINAMFGQAAPYSLVTAVDAGAGPAGASSRTEGLLGSVRTDASGKFVIRFATPLTLGEYVSATQDEPGIGSSELGGAVITTAGPQAAFTVSPSPLRPGATATLDGTTSGGAPASLIASYTWDFGDGTAQVTQATPIVTHAYSAAGQYTARLIVTAQDGSQSVATHGVSVQANAKPIAQVSTPASGIKDTTIAFDTSQSHDADGTIAQYKLDIDGDGTFDVTQAAPITQVHLPATAGTYHSKLVVVDNEGQASDAVVTDLVSKAPASPPVIVAPAPPAGLTPASLANARGNVVLQSTNGGVCSDDDCHPVTQIPPDDTCYTVIGTATTVALSATGSTCFKRASTTQLNGANGAVTKLFKTTGDFTLNGIAFTGTDGTKIAVTEVSGQVVQIVIDASTSSTLDIAFEGMDLSNKQPLKWKIDQTGAVTDVIHNIHTGYGTLPPATGATYNGLSVISWGMPQLVAGNAHFPVVTALPTGFSASSSATSSSPVTVVNGGLAQSKTTADTFGGTLLGAAPSTDTASEADNCATRLSGALPTSGMVTISLPQVSLGGVTLQSPILYADGLDHFIIKANANLPSVVGDIGGPVAIHAVVEIQDGKLRFGCFAENFGNTGAPLGEFANLTDLRAGVQLTDYVRISGTASYTAGPTVGGVSLLRATDTADFAFPNFGSGNTAWGFKLTGDETLLAGIGNGIPITGSLIFSSAGVFAFNVATDNVSFGVLTLKHMGLSGALDKDRNFDIEGSSTVHVPVLGDISGNGMITSKGVGVCADPFSATLTYSLSLNLSHSGCAWGDIAVSVKPTCPMLQTTIDTLTAEINAAPNSLFVGLLQAALQAAQVNLANHDCFDSPIKPGARWARAHRDGPTADDPLQPGQVADVGITPGATANAQEIILKGATDAPIVDVVDPAGNVIATPLDPNAVAVTGYRDVPNGETHIFVPNPTTGNYSIIPREGTSAVTDISSRSVGSATVSGSVSGSAGRTRTLTYHAGLQPGQQVRFEEVGDDAATIIATEGPGDGTADWTIANGEAGLRTVRAVILNGDGTTSQTKDVATFTAPDPVLPDAPAVTLSRDGDGVKVSWTGASSGVQGVATVTDGRTVAIAQPGATGSVTIPAVADGYEVHASLHSVDSSGRTSTGTGDATQTFGAAPAIDITTASDGATEGNDTAAATATPTPTATATVTATATPEPAAKKSCTVPKLKGLTVKQAKAKLKKAHCAAGKVKKVKARKGKRGRVLSSSPKAGKKLARTKKVSLKVRK